MVVNIDNSNAQFRDCKLVPNSDKEVTWGDVLVHIGTTTRKKGQEMIDILLYSEKKWLLPEWKKYKIGYSSLKYCCNVFYKMDLLDWQPERGDSPPPKIIA